MRESEIPNPDQVVAIRLKDYHESSYRKFLGIVGKKNAAWSVDPSTNSLLMDPDTGSEVQREMGAEDVTQTYRELQAKTEGFQVLRIAGQIKLEDGRKIRGTGGIIKDYSTGEYLHVNFMGHVREIPKVHFVMDALASGRYDTPSNDDLVKIYPTFKEAVMAHVEPI